MLGDHPVELVYIAGFEQPDSVPIRAEVTGAPPPQAPAAQAPANDLMLVRARPDGLAAFENALNLFFADVPQVEIEVKVVEYSTADSLSFGVAMLSKDTPSSVKSVSSGSLIKSITSQFPLSAPFLGSSSLSDRGIITLGGIHDNVELNAALELLASNNIADILSSPKLVVRNGGLATVATETELPFPKAKITSSGQNVTTDIEFKKTGIQLNIRPIIAGTQTVILQIYAKVSAVTSFAATEPVPTPIISAREVVSSVHVTNGKTTVIGGLVTDSTFESEVKIPVLGDIPILGYLFRSTSTQQSRTTLEFHITPRIIQGQTGVSAAPVGS
jgi:general secretion pathway protein D